jgi:ribosomal protein L37AE/L43A
MSRRNNNLWQRYEQQLKPCPDCGAPVGEHHRDGCDIERCPHCGWSALGCSHFDPNDQRREAWNGKWPGEEDCERLSFFVNGDPDFPDLNRLFTDLGCRHRALGAEAVST